MTGNGRMLGAMALAAGLALGAIQAQAADMIGNCEVTGTKGQFSITPAVPGQLTVEVNLPAPGFWNGDTPETIIPARNGTPLATSLYYPSLDGRRAPGTFPTLIERTPYDRHRLFLHLTASFFARRGYVVALQDVRGRGDSGGDSQDSPDSWTGSFQCCIKNSCVLSRLHITSSRPRRGEGDSLTYFTHVSRSSAVGSRLIVQR